MKRAFCFIVLCLTLLGCSSPHPSKVESWAENNGKIKVLSTTAMIDAIVGEIGGDLIEHIALITGEIDPHYYELVKGDDEKLSMSEIVFYNGLGLEHGASLRYQLEHHKNGVNLGRFILQKTPKEIVYVDKEVDPHIWMNVSLWSQIVGPIVQALSALDPKNSLLYEQRAEVLTGKMLQAHAIILKKMQQIPPERRFLVTSHDAFNYFAKAYLATPEEKESGEWKKRVAAPEGIAPEGQISVLDIQKVIEHLVHYQVGVIFPESNMSQDSLRKIVHACAQKGLQVAISSKTLYADTMVDSESYLDMIDHNVAVLLEGWDR